MRFLPIVVLAAASIAACSGNSEKAATPTTNPSAPATECAAGTSDPGRTVVVTVDDLVGGFGGMGTRTPSDLEAGPIRISVEADADNASPIDVTMSLNGSEVTAIRGVAAGTTCGVDLVVEPGHYELTDGTQHGKFDVVAAGAVTP
jgi:hypothetical protein